MSGTLPCSLSCIITIPLKKPCANHSTAVRVRGLHFSLDAFRQLSKDCWIHLCECHTVLRSGWNFKPGGLAGRFRLCSR